MAHPALTDEQCQEALDAFEANGRNVTRAAEALGLNRLTYNSRLRVALSRQRKGELEGRGARLVPHMEAVEVTDRFGPDGELEGFSVRQRAETQDAQGNPDQPLPSFVYKRISTLYGRENEKLLEWQIQSPDETKRAEMFRAAADAMAADLPRLPPIPSPAQTNEDLCALYTLTDAHIGMLAWHREGGADWDLNIAEATIAGCFAEAIRSAPAAHTAVLNQLGDLLHYDGLNAVTPTSGHILDADGRFTKMVEVAVRVLRRVIAMLLEKHERVHLVLAEGNHDMASSVWLRTMFKALYEHEPRITVDDSALPYYAYEHGQTMLVFHHSHLKKNDQLPALAAAQFAPMWGRTTKRYIHTGNLHHADEKEYAGATVIQHPTMAARDAYAARGGWWAERAMSTIIYHRRFGQVGRVTVCPEMLAA